ncbi:MAG: hypothetical protein GIW98_03375 [Candidatus Eremiobacteraeota bacterium]|nr:hypothetical protein [Candidatus Eremiobacteraeota bacterium]
MVERSSTGNDPPNPQWYYPHVVTGDTQINYSTAAVSPTSPAAAVVLDVTPTLGTAQVTLLDPLGHALQGPSTIPTGLSGGAGYFSPDAIYGVYQFLVTGTQRGNGADCGGTVTSGPSTFTDATWNALLSW